MPIRRLRFLLLGLLGAIAVGATGCSLMTPLPREMSVETRLAAFPTEGLPLQKAATVYWNDHKIPFVVAETDRDAAFVLGLVHAHLRLAQMELLKRVAQGRLSEAAGPVAFEIDHSLRILNFPRGAESLERRLPDETRAWLEAFAEGVNHYAANLGELPHEFHVMGLRPETWTVRDLLSIGRLAGTDINWLVYFRMLRLRDREDWADIWQRFLRVGSASTPSFAADRRLRMIETLLAGLSKSGSNSVAVGGQRSATGSALLANDPHLGLQLPNLWLVAGVHSPSHHAVGLMVPGLPMVAVGRNPWIAWGGTNMRAASSDLYDVGHLPESGFRTRRERIAVRWWFPRRVTVRETDLGPVLSDAPVLNWRGRPFALRWVGHETGDEVTALLAAARARNWTEFREAFRDFGVSAQNMLYADNEGNIGQIVATQLPIRPEQAPPDFILPGDDPRWQWRGFLNTLDLPHSYNPADGFLASANNRPVKTDIPLGYIFSPDDRMDRMRSLLDGTGRLDVADLERLQADVYMPSSVTLRDALLGHVDRLEVAAGLDAEASAALEAMRKWDGHYRVDSRGAIALELVGHHVLQRFYTEELGEAHVGAFTSFGGVGALLIEDLDKADSGVLAGLLREALGEAGTQLRTYPTWGEMHRLGLAHPLSFAPVIGRRYRFGDFPVAGGRETLMKTASAPTGERHYASYGQQARHISDLSDVDRNYFVLLGGQDGWLNSATALDQVDLWRTGGYIRVPLRLETVRDTFRHRSVLRPPS